MNCRLCLDKKIKNISTTNQIPFYLCSYCNLITKSPEDFITSEEEIDRYLLHNNGIENQGYVDFLNIAIEPTLKYIKKNMLGLDYGCGYNPTLSKLLNKLGFNCENYDPYFVMNDLSKNYDFIFSTEVFEHFKEPRKEIEKITELLKTNGLLIIMTERWDDILKFGNWYYHKDPTHVAFYNNKTFAYLDKEFNLKKIYDDNKKITIHKKL